MIINLLTRSNSEVENAHAGYSPGKAACELSRYGIHVYAVENARDKIIVSVFGLLEARNV